MTALGPFFGLGMTGTEIYHNFRDGTGDDGRGLYQAAYVVAGIADNYQRRGDSIKDLVGQMESAWQGNAAGAAQRGAGPLAVEHGLASPEITTAREALRNQVDVFSKSKGAVVEVPPEPQEPGIWDNITTLGGASQDYQTSKAYYDAANDHNVSVMEIYEGETDNNTTAMPTTYGSITPDHSGIGVRDRTGPNQPLPWIPPDDPGGPGPGERDPGRGDNNNFTNTNNNQSQNLTTNPNQNQTTLPNNNGGGGLTVPADRPGNDPRFPPGPIGPGPGPGNPNNPNNMHPPGFMPGSAPFGPNGGDNARSGSGYGPRGGGGFGPGGSGGSGAGSTGSGGRGGMGGGAMPGAAAAAEGAARPGAAGMRGGGGMMGGGGGMGGGGRRQDGEDDTEHERPSFLVEPDPHDTFGTDEVTAPPVIGE
jgi:hypothetical protein